MSEHLRVARPDEPQAEIWYYNQKHYKGGSRSEIDRLNLSITVDEMVVLTNLQTGEILNVPQSFVEYARQEKIALDRIAVIHVVPTHGSILEPVARFFVAGVGRQGTMDIETNRFRPFIPEDDKWVTVAQRRSGSGVFEVSVDHVTDGESWTAMNAFVLEPTDKVVNLIGEDFRVIDPRAETTASNPAANQKPAPV